MRKYWWLFEIINGEIFLANPEPLQKRPLDAQDSNGDVYTPWYKKEDHFDSAHIHIQAESYNVALEKARQILIKIKDHSSSG